MVASAQASEILYPVRLRKIRSAGSRVRDRSFHTVRETRSLKNVDRARFLADFSVISGVSSKRIDARVQRWTSYSSIGRVRPDGRDAESEKVRNWRVEEGCAAGIPLRSIVKVVFSSCRSSRR